MSGPVRPVALKDEMAAVAAAGLDSETRAAQSAAEAASASEDVRYAGPAVLMYGVAAIAAAGPDSEARAVEPAAGAAFASEAVR